MVKKRKLTIALFTDRMCFSLPTDMFRGVGKAGSDFDVNILTITGAALDTSQGYLKQANVLYKMINPENVDGLLFASTVVLYNASSEQLADFCNQYRPLPIVSLGIPMQGIPSIVPENKPGMYALVEHLIREHGKTNIAFVGGPAANLDARERYDAYRQALADNGLTLDAELVLPGDFEHASGIKAVDILFNERKKVPGKDVDAIVAINDYMARAVFLELHQKGIRVPEDIAVTGFDDIFPVRCLSTPLTSVYVPFVEIGYRAVELLLDLIKRKSAADSEAVYRVPSQLRIRKSCGCMEQNSIRRTKQSRLPDELYSCLIHHPGNYLEELDRESLKDGIASSDFVIWEEPLALLRHNVPGERPDTTLTPPKPGECGAQIWQAIGRSIYIGFHRMQLINIQTHITRSLSSTVSIPKIIQILEKELPLLGIKNCYLVLYNNPPLFTFPQYLPATSRLIMAFTEQNIFELPEGGISFPTLEIVPNDYLKYNEGRPLVMEALYFQEQQIGYILFDAGAEDERVYSELQLQISSSLQGALLVQKVKEHALQLSKANEEIQVLNEKLKAENVDMRMEMKVSRRIQTALLPREKEKAHRDFEITGCMLPADEVGGDYYDIITDRNGALWLGIGDVSGHGVTPGLIMMMAQTMHAVITNNYTVSPSDVVLMINSILQNNVCNRLQEKNYMTFTTLKYLGNGLFQHAGLHLDLIIYRQDKKACELVATSGTWLNLLPKIDDVIKNNEFTLNIGDLLILHTDGMTEVFNENKEMLGIQGLIDLVNKYAHYNVNKLQKAILKEIHNWRSGKIKDDMTLVLLRRCQ